MVTRWVEDSRELHDYVTVGIAGKRRCCWSWDRVWDLYAGYLSIIENGLENINTRK